MSTNRAGKRIQSVHTGVRSTAYSQATKDASENTKALSRNVAVRRQARRVAGSS